MASQGGVTTVTENSITVGLVMVMAACNTVSRKKAQRRGCEKIVCEIKICNESSY